MVQDPVSSLRRQVRSVQEKAPPGSFIAAWFWDIESGGLDPDQRGHGSAHEKFDVVIPRDGGLADLLTEAASPNPRFAAVICEDIERSGRDTFNALKLERQLADAGIPRAQRTYLLRGRVRCRPCQRRMHGATRQSSRYYTGGPDVDHVYYLCPHDTRNPRHAAQAPGHPVTVSVREDVLLACARQFFAVRVFGPDRKAVLAQQLPAGAAEDAARRAKQAARLRKRLARIDSTEDAHVREVQALAELDPHSPAVKAMRTRHLARFTELEAERDNIGRRLTTLAKQATQEAGGDPALLDAIPPLGDVLGQVPDKIKQKLFDAFDVQALYSKTSNQVTFWATITPATPTALAAIIAASETPDLAALLAAQDHLSDLASQPGTTRSP